MISKHQAISFVGCAIIAFALAPPTGWGQGIPMSPDFLPLEVGNTWNYELEDEGGQVTSFAVEILDHQIVEGLSLYIFSRMPFAPNGTFDDPIGVHFDRQQRQYIYTDGIEQDVLFPARGQGAAVVETDDAGLPLVVELDYGSRFVRIERGVGIIGGSLTFAGGRGEVALVGARVGPDLVGEPAGRPGLPVLDVEAPVDNVVLPSDTAPLVEIEAMVEDPGHRFVLRLRNPTDKLMPFDFTTSQSFDFVVTDETGQEVWRWATRMFFSQVLRSEALRAEGEWEFEAEWNHTDGDLNPVPPGAYTVRGILTAETRYESEDLPIQID